MFSVHCYTPSLAGDSCSTLDDVGSQFSTATTATASSRYTQTQTPTAAPPTPRIEESIQEEQVPPLSKREIRKLTAEQIQEKTPREIKAIVRHFSGEQVRLLTARQLRPVLGLLSKKGVRELSAEQIQKIPGSELDAILLRLSKKQLRMLQNAQLETLSEDKVKKLSKSKMYILAHELADCGETYSKHDRISQRAGRLFVEKIYDTGRGGVYKGILKDPYISRRITWAIRQHRSMRMAKKEGLVALSKTRHSRWDWVGGVALAIFPLPICIVWDGLAFTAVSAYKGCKALCSEKTSN